MISSIMSALSIATSIIAIIVFFRVLSKEKSSKETAIALLKAEIDTAHKEIIRLEKELDKLDVSIKAQVGLHESRTDKKMDQILQKVDDLTNILVTNLLKGKE